MFDFYGALSARRIVSDALFINRWFDDLDAMQNNRISSHNGALQVWLRRLGTDYNQLVDEYNQLAKVAAATMSEAEVTIAELRQRLVISELAREKAENEVAFLRAFEELRSEPV